MQSELMKVNSDEVAKHKMLEKNYKSIEEALHIISEAQGAS